MRGKETFNVLYSGGNRITPAHAGKSDRFAIAPAADEDHPRPCGEKFCREVFALCQEGSPPPMRGKAYARVLSI